MAHHTAPPGDLTPYRTGRWRGWIHPDWRDAFGETDPLAWVAAHPCEVVPRNPVSRTRRVFTEYSTLYAKHTTGPGIGSPENPIAAAPWQYPKWLLRSSALHVAIITTLLKEHDLPAPPVVLAARRATGLRRDDLLITQAAPGKTLRRLFRMLATREEQERILLEAAQAIARFHAAGFVHGDLLPGNILVDPDTQAMVLIDHDRTQHRAQATWPARRRNLEQMTFRLMRMAPTRRARFFLDAYFHAADLPMDRHQVRRATAQILRNTHARFGERDLNRVASHRQYTSRSTRRRDLIALREARRALR